VQNIPPDQLFWETAAICDKAMLKTNTLIVIVASSSGKTRVINNPLVILARFLGRISNRNKSSAFAWMDCGNVRLVSIDEALMAPEAIESFKNVAGGDNTRIEVKHEASMTIAHTPLTFTANRPLWEGAKDQATAIHNRSFCHRVSVSRLSENGH